MASIKRELASSSSDEHRLKKARVDESEPAASNMRVALNPADCDIDFNVEGDGLQGSALYEEGFAYCWSGARANIGIRRGKYCFGCKIVSAQPVHMEDTPLGLQNVCRVGISRGDGDVRNLGETLNSFGFGGTGKFSNSGNFSNYGEGFGVGDTIICAVDLESLPMASISFSKNGNWLGVAKHFDAGPNGLEVVGSPVKRLHWESALFPHVLLKNVVVQLQFSVDDGLNPVEGYKPWDAAVLDGNAMLGPAFSNVDGCEVIMMVGLPASGKSSWAEKWVKEHPEKRYVLLGTNLALEQMKVPGLLRKHNYGERFDLLMDRATKIFNVLLSRASKIPRNFIIDQTNVYKSARKRKLKPFADYIKIAAVVFPRAEELKNRADKRFNEMGKEVPAEAVNEMLANYSLPMSKDMHMADEYFDQVWFLELSREESQRILDEMKRDMSKKSGGPPGSHEKSSLMPCSSFSLRQKSPIQSYTDVSLQNQGVGGSYQSSYSSQPLSGWFSTPTYGGMADLSQNYGMHNANYHTGVESGHLLHGGTITSSRSDIAELNPVTSSSSYNTGDYRCLNVPGGGTPYYPLAMAHSAPQPATHIPYGSYGPPIPRPPLGSFTNDVQHAGVYPSPSRPCPPPVNFPMDVEPNYGNFAMQCYGAYPQVSPLMPPQPSYPMDVQLSGFCPPPQPPHPHRY